MQLDAIGLDNVQSKLFQLVKPSAPLTGDNVSRLKALDSSFAAPASWMPNRGYLDYLLDLERIGSRGLRLGLAGLATRTKSGRWMGQSTGA